MAAASEEALRPADTSRVWVLVVHLVAVSLIQSTGFAIQFILPVLARKRFEANDWQTLIITASPTILFSLSIFWNDIFGRMRFGRYLLLYWLIACAPMALAGFSQEYWWLAACHVLASVGGAGYHPAAGELLRAFYRERTRGRVYGVLWGATLIGGAALGYGVGEVLTRDPDAFRIYMPAGAGVQLIGVLLLAWLSRATGHSASRAIISDARSVYERVIEPMTHMREVLREDKVFFRYEAAYMTYGVGWMIAFALLPIFVTDQLQLDYDQVARSTHVAYLLAMVVTIVPAGWLMDRLGAVRSTGLSFALLTLHPLGLMWAGSEQQLMLVSVVYGVAHAGASMGWMLGPVALAPSPAKVAQYVAIHATMVGIRGKVFQGVGVGLYMLGRWLRWPLEWCFAVPLIIAVGAYLLSAWQMWRLDQIMKSGTNPRRA